MWRETLPELWPKPAAKVACKSPGVKVRCSVRVVNASTECSKRRVRSDLWPSVGAGGVGIGFAPLAQIDFSEVLSTLWRGKWTIVASSLIALALALVFIAVARS
ncbi:MAG: Wzz/FepE/Etk N-terminal domain-containing protein [Xanthobacteraceae bacterium]